MEPTSVKLGGNEENYDQLTNNAIQGWIESINNYESIFDLDQPQDPSYVLDSTSNNALWNPTNFDMTLPSEFAEPFESLDSGFCDDYQPEYQPEYQPNLEPQSNALVKRVSDLEARNGHLETQITEVMELLHRVTVMQNEMQLNAMNLGPVRRRFGSVMKFPTCANTAGVASG